MVKLEILWAIAEITCAALLIIVVGGRVLKQIRRRK
jgi:hypothetical protein